MEGACGIGEEGERGHRTLPDKLNLRGSVDYITRLQNTVKENFCANRPCISRAQENGLVETG